MRRCILVGVGFVVGTVCWACAPPDDGGSRDRFDTTLLMDHVRVLSSDEFGGRAPGSPGEEKTVAYLTEAFRSMGLAPGNSDGTFVQQVPLLGITATDESHLSLVRGRDEQELAAGLGYVAWTKRVVDEVTLDAELVFVGYGVVAPEYDWDDYKDIDVAGKVLVMLVNDPPLDDAFGGNAMTYYGRWTYKFEIAAAKGAAGAFVVHETVPAGYPWEVVGGSWSGESFDLQTPDNNMSRVAVEGWFSSDVAHALFEQAGFDFAEQKRAAAERSFRPVALGTRARAEIKNELREVSSANVVAKLEGSDDAVDAILYVAHWDHLGTLPAVEGDNIFNGAYDNATGVAGLLELARVYSELDPAPSRSVVFLAVTAEEQGLLGSRHYAENPLIPIADTVAVINMDGLNIWGRSTDVTIVGLGQSSLDDLATEIVARHGRTVIPDPAPENGTYYRSDHFEFAKVGIPAFYSEQGITYEGRPEGWGEIQRAKYVADDYHKPSDEIKPWFETAGMVQDLDLFYEMGLALATSDTWPTWSETSEFRSKR
jgi:Zn-dependent M28 family amino/carboxypeptidase